MARQVDVQMSKVTAIMDHIAPEMDAIGARYEQPDAPVVSLRDQTKKVLRENTLLTRVELLSTNMATHPDNRFGDMIVPKDVPALISGIYTQGFSFLQLVDPTCSEMPPPGHARRQHCIQKNRQLIEGSGGLLPAYEDYEKIHDMTLTCGHTSQGNRMWIHGCEHPDPRFTIDGKLNLRRLEELQPVYHQAVTQGMPWERIHWAVEDRWPWVPKLMQETGNAGQAIARCVSRMQLILQIREIAARLETLHPGEDWWERVQREALRAGSPFADEVEAFTIFVREMSGGLQNPWILMELRDFVRSCQSYRTVRGPLLQAIAELRLKGCTSATVPHFRLALCKALLSCSDKYAEGDRQRLMKSTEVTALGRDEKKVEVIKLADAFLQDTRELVDQHGVPDTLRSSMVGMTDVRTIHFVLNKPDPSRGVFPTMDGIGYQLSVDLANALKTPITSKWPAPTGEQPKASPKEVPTTKVIDAKGAWANTSVVLEQKGFTKSVQVKHIKTGSKYTIIDVTNACVKLKALAGAAESSHSHSVFLDGQYAIWEDKTETLADHSPFDPSKSAAWVWGLVEARLRASLDNLHRANRSCLGGLVPTIAPSRALVAKHDFSAGEIVLVPLTSTFSRLDLTTKPAPTHALLDELFIDPVTKKKQKVVLTSTGGVRLPAVQKKQPNTGIGAVRQEADHIIALYWFVRASDDEDLVNVRVKKINGIPCLVNNKKVKKGTELLRSPYPHTLEDAQEPAAASKRAPPAPPTASPQKSRRLTRHASLVA